MAMIGSLRNFTTMLKSMSTLGINNSLVKLFVENKEDKNELSIIYSTFFWLFFSISAILGVLVFLFSNAISNFLFFKNSFAIPIQVFGISLPLIVINAFWLAIYNGLEKFKKIVIIQIISNLLVFIISTYLIWKHQIFGGLLAIALGEVMMVFVTFVFVRKELNFFQFNLQKTISKKHVKVIQNFSIMALLTAVIAPLSLIFIRNLIVSKLSIETAGLWDATNRLSVFYMMFFNTGLSLYYMPKLASLKSDDEFKAELKSYFSFLVPLFFVMLLIIFFLRSYIINTAFTNEFKEINSLLIWQMLGDFFRIVTLAFGFQIVVKMMIRKYFIIEIIFNGCYFLFSYFLIDVFKISGVLQAYFYSNLISFFIVIIMFRNLFYKYK